jgi:hypothetical protein
MVYPLCGRLARFAASVMQEPKRQDGPVVYSGFCEFWAGF